MSFRENYITRTRLNLKRTSDTGLISTPTAGATDITGMTVLLLIGLNVNHVLSQLSGIQAILWPVVVLLLAILCLRYGSLARTTDVYILFVSFVCSYLISATLTSLANAQIEWILLISYFTTLIF